MGHCFHRDFLFKAEKYDEIQAFKTLVCSDPGKTSLGTSTRAVLSPPAEKEFL